jgi:hypothetical protein
MEFEFNSIQFNNWIKIQIPFNANSSKNKWDANWWKIYSKSSCDYGVGKKTLEKQNFEMAPFHASSLGNG